MNVTLIQDPIFLYCLPMFNITTNIDYREPQEEMAQMVNQVLL